MLRVRFDFGPVFDWLVRLADGVGRSVPVLRNAAEVVDQAIQRNFDAEGRPTPWKPLTFPYARRKARKYPGTKILELHGYLRRSIRIGIDATNPSLVGIFATSPLPYAAIHNFGGLAGEDRNIPIPPRPYLVLTEEDQQELGRAVVRGLAEEL